MNVSPISSQVSKPVSFKHYLNVDIGASTLKGSCKIKAIDERNGRTLAEGKTTIFDEDSQRSEESFVDCLAERIADFESQHSDKLRDGVKLTVCYPGPLVSTAEGSAVYLTNFYHDDKKQNSFANPIVTEDVDTALKNNGVKLVRSRHVNDMAGGGACLLNKLLENEKYYKYLKNGEQIVYMYPGGGLGTGVIDVDKNEFRIRPTEMQHIKRNGDKTFEMSACASALSRNFEDAMGLPEGSVGEKTMLVTQYDAFNEEFPNISKRRHDEASKDATLKLMDSLGDLIAVKVCEAKAHTVILTGKIMGGVRDSVNNNPLFDEYKTNNDKSTKFNNCLEELVQDHLSRTGKRILNDPDKKLNILFIESDDNTSGAHLLHRGEGVGNPPNWYGIKK